MSGLNYISIPCPNCAYEQPMQSKAGSCMGEEITLYYANLAELQECVDADIICEGCGAEIEVIVMPHIMVQVDKQKRSEGLN